MKNPLIIIVLVLFGMLTFGQSSNTTNSNFKKNAEGNPMIKRSNNIKYIDISIQQPGVEVCLGVNIPRQGFYNEWIDVYPNPNPGQFTLELQLQDAGTTLLIQLYDLAGKQVYESSDVPNGNRFRKDLDVNHLKKGVYFLHVTGKDKVGVKQIIIN
jgi:hypothetical protein